MTAAVKCAECGLDLDWVDAMPEYDIEAGYVHRRGRWRVPADHAGQPEGSNA